MPLISAVASAAGAYLAVVGVHCGIGGTVEISPRSAVVCLAGALYTNLFEHAWHRFAMHSRRPDPRHALHHRLFYGNRFQTDEPAALQEITTKWYIFPLLLPLHYVAFVLLLPPPLAPAFFLGVVLHFITYETSHWYTHVANNGFDRIVARVPGIRRLRARQIEHHRLHHIDPKINFNFTPPYVGDRVGGVLRR